MPPENVLLENLGALCNMVRRTALEAGEIILEYYDDLKDPGTLKKGDGSPVTLADTESEAMITAALADLTPSVPVIGEEAAEEGRLPDLGSTGYFWLVDPLDGTKEFISGGTEFTVNIALIKDSIPVMGVVYAPATGVMYAAHGQNTAVRWNEDTNKEKLITVRPLLLEGLTVAASKSHGSAEKLEAFLGNYKINKVIKRGSSLKICAIAEGKADIYPRFGLTSEWDTAAGDAILRAAGGMITDLEGNPLQYGGARPKFLNPEFIASSFKWHSSD